MKTKLNLRNEITAVKKSWTWQMISLSRTEIVLKNVMQRGDR